MNTLKTKKLTQVSLVVVLASFIVGSIVFGGGGVPFMSSADTKTKISDANQEAVLGANIPDRCEFYDQVASRSVKDNVKAAGGTLYSYRVVSTGTNLRYFRIHDLATVPTTGATVEYAMPLDTTTASATPKVVEEKFAVPMKFDNGISWSLSTNFGTWGSVSTEVRDSYFVTLCYQ